MPPPFGDASAGELRRMDVIGNIYEAAFIPERWPTVLDQMSAMSGSQTAVLYLFARDRPLQAVITDMTKDMLDPFLQSNPCQTSPSAVWTMTARPSSFSAIEPNLSPEELAGDPEWTELVSRGIGQRLTSVIQMPGGEMVTPVFARMKRDGPYRRRDAATLDRLRPHLNRAGQIAARLGLGHTRAIVETLDRIGLAAAAIDRTGRVIVANPLLEAMPEMFVPTAFGGIAIAERVADERFRSALLRIGRDSAETVVSLPVRGKEGAPPLLVHLLPICGHARDIFTGGHILMVAVKVERRRTPRPESLHGLFDLTPAEARLVGELVHGGALPEIAGRTGLSHHTLRAQLRSVLAKTGVHRQADLLQLIAAL
jgi:DNA-binding CsgD family transcriptional regulator